MFSLRGITYQNNTRVSLEGIGEGDDALLCITNQTVCCSPPYTGEMGFTIGNWFFPNGTEVPGGVVNATSGTRWNFYRDRGEMVVRMHRRRGGEYGIYRCEVPDARNITQAIFIAVYTGSEWYIHVYMYHESCYV